MPIKNILFLVPTKENTATVTRKSTDDSSQILDKAFHGGIRKYLLVPNQPTEFNFPKRSFGIFNVRHLSFHAQWFEKYSWLHYEETTDKELCFICMKAFHEGKVLSNQVDKAFIEKQTVPYEKYFKSTIPSKTWRIVSSEILQIL